MNQKVAEAFKKLYFGKRTGVLTCEASSVRRAVMFHSGFVVGARSTLAEDRLGEVMMRHGRITRQQFEDASHFIKSGRRLGEILVELKIVTAEEIETFVRHQLLDIVCMQLIAPPRKLAFAPVSEVEGVLDQPLSVADILMEAARRTPKLGKRLEALKNSGRRLGFPRDPMKRFQEVNLNPEEAFVLSRIDGTQTAKDIFAVSPLPEERTARTLIGLLQAELIEPEGEGEAEKPPDAKLATGDGERPKALAKGHERDRERAEVERLYEEFQFKDHWQVLGLDQRADAEAVREAFIRLARHYHPDRFRSVSEPQFQEKLSYVFHRISEAHDTLSSKRREGYEALAQKDLASVPPDRSTPAKPGNAAPALDAGTAKDLLLRAKVAFRGDDFWECIQLCLKGIEHDPQSAETYHLLGVALSKNPKWRQDAEKNLRIAANLDPWRPEYQMSLARFYRAVGLHLRAERAMEKARAIDPGVTPAE
ncbi:MAG TPA: J domain-containing protein [Vicinamibacteria bacterium]|nr:J domain-containing protein [Vicinamibacteria bacterium]